MKLDAPKEVRFQIWLELNTGKEYEHDVKVSAAQLDKVLAMIDECWQSSGKQDGYIRFDNSFYRVSSIVHYAFERVKPWWKLW